MSAQQENTDLDARLARAVDPERVAARLDKELPAGIARRLLESDRLRRRTLTLALGTAKVPENDWLGNPIVDRLLTSPAERERLAGLCGVMVHAQQLRLLLDARTIHVILETLGLTIRQYRFGLSRPTLGLASAEIDIHRAPGEAIQESGWRVLATWRTRLPEFLAARLALLVPEDHPFNRARWPELGPRATEIAAAAAEHLRDASTNAPRSEVRREPAESEHAGRSPCMDATSNLLSELED